MVKMCFKSLFLNFYLYSNAAHIYWWKCTLVSFAVSLILLTYKPFHLDLHSMHFFLKIFLLWHYKILYRLNISPYGLFEQKRLGILWKNMCYFGFRVRTILKLKLIHLVSWIAYLTWWASLEVGNLFVLLIIVMNFYGVHSTPQRYHLGYLAKL